MLFVLVLFFLLLGTSVGAYPVGPHPGALYEGIELPKPYKFVTNLIPPDRRPRLNDPQPLLLSNIQHHTGLWYQRPEDGQDISAIFQIFLEQNNFKDLPGIVLFHQITWRPHKHIKYHENPYIFLTEETRNNLLGTWFLMSSTINRKMTVTLLREGEAERLMYSVEKIKPMENPIYSL